MLLLFEERLLEPELRDLLLLPLALGLLPEDLLLLFALGLLLRDEPDLDEEEELRDAIACSFGE